MSKEKTATHYLKFGFKSTFERLIGEISALDETILAYNEQLERAQPLFSGRVLVKFSACEKIRIEDEDYCDRIPKVGKMIKRSGGNWIFVWIKDADYSKLEDLRVGKRSKWDRPVVKLLRALGRMLTIRREIIKKIKILRGQLSNASQSVSFRQSKEMAGLLEISSEIEDDWSVNAKELLEKHFEGKSQAMKTGAKRVVKATG